eukprot:s518_g24.t1
MSGHVVGEETVALPPTVCQIRCLHAFLTNEDVRVTDRAVVVHEELPMDKDHGKQLEDDLREDERAHEECRFGTSGQTEAVCWSSQKRHRFQITLLVRCGFEEWCVIIHLADSGHANGTPEKNAQMRYRSVGGSFALIADRKMRKGRQFDATCSVFTGQTKRVCRSTLAAEASHLAEAEECGDSVTVLIEETLTGDVDLKNWSSLIERRERVYVTDAKSVYDYLQRDAAPTGMDKRMATEGALGNLQKRGSVCVAFGGEPRGADFVRVSAVEMHMDIAEEAVEHAPDQNLENSAGQTLCELAQLKCTWTSLKRLRETIATKFLFATRFGLGMAFFLRSPHEIWALHLKIHQNS